MASDIDFSNPADPYSTAINQLAEDMAHFPNDPNKPQSLAEWILSGAFDSDISFLQGMGSGVLEALKERSEHPFRYWMHRVWWTIIQLFHKV